MTRANKDIFACRDLLPSDNSFKMPCNTWPKIRCPVVIGGDSILRTAEDLRNLCQLSSVPLVIQTTKTNLIPLPGEEDDKNKVPVHISDVSVR